MVGAGFTGGEICAMPILLLILGPVVAARSLASGGALPAGQPIDGFNIDANSVSTIKLPLRTR